MRQAQRKSYWRFSHDFQDKKKIIKRGKCRGKPRITHIHRWFSGRKPEVTGPKLTFSRSNRHDCPVQPIESSADMPKLVIISHQSKKKWQLEGKKIHPGKIPLYRLQTMRQCQGEGNLAKRNAVFDHFSCSPQFTIRGDTLLWNNLSLLIGRSLIILVRQVQNNHE